MPANAIVVNVQEPRRVCFIVTPFAARFDELSDLIQGAANDFQLQSVRTDRVRHSASFVKDIFDLTRSSRIIVAVCSPEGQGTSNPNVMYELGLAHALGKPTIIMTDDLSALPKHSTF
jgi:nucleoside 2-deoxyribosyltransferase